jgi:RNA polymerase sigma-70 factor (ECF subfamily)
VWIQDPPPAPDASRTYDDPSIDTSPARGANYGPTALTDAVVRIDAAARIDAPPADAGMAREVRGASTWARQFIGLSRGLRFVQPALINGSVGLILAPGGKLSRALTFTFTNAKVTQVEVIGDPARLRELDIAVL